MRHLAWVLMTESCDISDDPPQAKAILALYIVTTTDCPFLLLLHLRLLKPGPFSVLIQGLAVPHSFQNTHFIRLPIYLKSGGKKSLLARIPFRMMYRSPDAVTQSCKDCPSLASFLTHPLSPTLLGLCLFLLLVPLWPSPELNE